MVVMSSSSTPLRQFREELTDPRVSQEDLARVAGVTLQTYRNAETGKNCTYTTATALLSALNSERQARGKKPLSLDQLGLSIV
jgi:DNA-binding XRE family transcriptional regulator